MAEPAGPSSICARRLRRWKIWTSCSSCAPTVGICEHEALELRLALEPGVGSVAEQLVQVVEVVARHRVGDLVHPRDVAGEAEHRAQLVAHVLVVGVHRTEVAHEVLDRGGAA